MITLEKLMSELKNESVTEIVAGSGWNDCCPLLKHTCDMKVSWDSPLLGKIECSTGKMTTEVGDPIE